MYARQFQPELQRELEPSRMTADELLKILQKKEVLQRAYLLEDLTKSEQGLLLISEAYEALKQSYTGFMHIFPQIKHVNEQFCKQGEAAIELNGVILSMLENIVHSHASQLQPDNQMLLKPGSRMV